MSIKYWLPLMAILLLIPKPVLAAHCGSAPTDPQAADDENFVTDTDPGLDTGCTYREGGPLKFKVGINRYVRKANKDDKLLTDVALLKEQKVISPTIKLVMPAYDIDSDQGEVDEVYFNGHKIGTLQGSDGTWQENEFTIPIEWVKFPTAKGSAITGQMQPPVAAENEIQINIDTKGEGWCASIDWAEIRLKAMAPLVLIHGIGANPQAAWEEKPGVAKELASMGIPFEHRIEIGPNNTIFSRVDDKDKVIEGNATLLEREIYRIATSFGVQKVHIVGHSKGGLDSRGYLARNYHPEKVKVLSLYTLSSPHHGSVLADISVLARDKNLRLVEGGSVEVQEGDSEMKIFLKADSLLVFTAGGPQLPGLRDLQTNSAKILIGKLLFLTL